MAVLIDARPLQNEHAFRGVGTLVRNLLREMERLDEQQRCHALALPGDPAVPFFTKRQVEAYQFPQSKQLKRFEWLPDQLLIPRLLRRGSFSVFFATDFNSYVRPAGGAKQVAIAYDLIPFLFPQSMAEQPLLAA
jgi:hypothetical protein